jgi:hypothetical protein
LLCALAFPNGAVAQPAAAPPKVLDGPSADIVGVDGVSVARDGSGGLVYVKDVDGVAHVFASRLESGVFQPPVQVDAGMAGSSSQPVIAASNGGLLVVAFINGGQLYAVQWTGSGASSTAPNDLFSGAANPAISITTLGKVYVAFTASGDGGHDVRCAYYYNGVWGLEPTPLDVVASDDAGTGSGRPAVAASGDGVAIVAWGEGGHIYSRRVWATAPSVAYQQADVPGLGGWSEVSADEPAVATGGNSSYANVVFHEVFASGSKRQSRVLTQRLQAGSYDGLVQSDGLTTPGAEGADQPAVDAGEYGQGFITSGRDTSHQLIAMQLGNNGTPEGVQRLDSVANAGMPYAIPAAAGYHSDLIAWQQDPGPPGAAEIRARFFNGTSLGPEQVLSSPSMGPTQASKGLVAAGDIGADMAVAWVQGTGASTEIVTTQIYQPPGGFNASSASQYFRTATQTLAWTPSQDRWGPIVYTVSVDGAQVAQTSGTSAAVPNSTYPLPLAQGAHTWQVTATNPAGLTRSDKVAKFFIDTVPPVVTFKLTGRQRVGSVVHVGIRATDAPPPLARSQASGIASIEVKFGDGHSYVVTRGKYHVYHRAAHYTVTVIVTDKAGNVTTVKRRIRIAPAPKPKKKGKHAPR